MLKLIKLKLLFEKYITSKEDYHTKSEIYYAFTKSLNKFQGGRKIARLFESRYQYSITTTFQSFYPSLKLSFSDADKVSKNYWSLDINKRFFLEEISRNFPFPIRRQHDWLQLDAFNLREVGGIPLYRFDSSITEILERIFPGMFWEKISRYPSFAALEKKRVFVDELVLTSFNFVEVKAQLNVIDSQDLLALPGGCTLLRYNSNSSYLVFYDMYPELFPIHERMHDGYWNERMSIDKLLALYFEFVHVQEDLLDLTTRYFSGVPGGATVLTINNGSLQGLFQRIYLELVVSSGKYVSRDFWQNVNKNSGIQKTMAFYSLKTKEDWYKLSNLQFSRMYGKVTKKKYMVNLLNYLYPEEEWIHQRFSDNLNKRSMQRYLGLRVMEIFKNEVVFEDFLFKQEDRHYIFDFYIPGMKLVIEYQGEQHYYNIIRWLSLESQKNRDEEKQKICTDNGFTLLHVPYWWDGSSENLSQILQNQLFRKTIMQRAFVH